MPKHITKQDNCLTVKKLNIPVSIRKNSLGNELIVERDNGLITNIILNHNKAQLNFIEIIRNKAKFFRPYHKHNITSFANDYKFYLLKDNSGDFVLAVRIISAFSIEKIRYSLNGVILNHLVDYIKGKYTERVSGNKIILFDSMNNNKVISMRQDIKLKAIEKPKTKSSFIENSNIGVIDIETIESYDNIQKVYALGFKTGLEEPPIIYYIDKNTLDSNKIVFSMINELLRAKYKNIKFYCQNLGGYDIVFLLKILYDFNDYINTLELPTRPSHLDGGNYKKEQMEYDLKNSKYKISCILRDSIILKVTISRNIANKNYSFTITDSFAMLSDKLLDLGINF